MPGTLADAFYISFSLQKKLCGTCIVIISILDEETEAALGWPKAKDWDCASRAATVYASNIRRM